MNICSDGHPEICFEGRDCPFCAYIYEKESEILSLNADLKRLEGLVP